ncbi:hypothetical protein ES708_11722 [subsurface metagenome]
MKQFLLLLVVVLFPVFAVGQPSKSDRDNIRKQKIEFFNKKLNLTKTEAEKFWPVYNDYQNRKNKIFSEKRALIHYYMQNSDYMSSDEISETLEKYISYERQETDLLTAFNEKFRKVLPDERVLKIYVAEIQFKEHLIHQLRTDK